MTIADKRDILAKHTTGDNMIYLYINETQRLAEIVSELVKLNMNVVVELHGNKWWIEVTK